MAFILTFYQLQVFCFMIEPCFVPWFLIDFVCTVSRHGLQCALDDCGNQSNVSLKVLHIFGSFPLSTFKTPHYVSKFASTSANQFPGFEISCFQLTGLLTWQKQTQLPKWCGVFKHRHRKMFRNMNQFNSTHLSKTFRPIAPFLVMVAVPTDIFIMKITKK